MARRCKIYKKNRQVGNRVSHANNKRKHEFKPNLQTKRIYIDEEHGHVKLKLSTRIIRTIDKIGLHATLRKHGMTLKDLGVQKAA